MSYDINRLKFKEFGDVDLCFFIINITFKEVSAVNRVHVVPINGEN